MSSAPEASRDDSEVGSGCAEVDLVLAELAGLDLSAAPAGLLPTLATAHDALAARLRAVEE